MTAEQKQRILEMRDAGMGYSRIATSLSLSVNTVKSFCQRNAKPSKSAPQVVVMPKDQKPAYCKKCGKSIVQMPGGIPVATTAVGNSGATNAGLLAVSILSITDGRLADELKAYRESLKEKVAQSNAELV